MTPVGILGGAERALVEMVSSLVAHPSAPAVSVVVGTDGPLLPVLEAAGAQVRPLLLPNRLLELGDSGVGRRLEDLVAFGGRIASASAETLRFTLRLRALVAAEGAEVVHSNGMKMHALLPFLGSDAIRVLHAHDFFSSRPVMARLLRAGAGRIDAVVAVSRAVAEDARDALALDEVDVVYNAVDTDAFSPGAARPGYLEALAGRPTDTPALRIGLVATWARWKGHGLFLEACAEVARAHPGLLLRFFLIGGPLYQTAGSQWTEGELTALAAQVGLADHLYLVPFQREMPEVYRALDVVVHASTLPEPFGMTIAEAMSCGRATVVSAAGGARELYTDGADALGYPAGKKDALAAAISKLLSNEAVRRVVAAAARQTAVAKFSRRRLGSELLALYARLRRR